LRAAAGGHVFVTGAAWHWPLHVHGLADAAIAVRLLAFHACIGLGLSLLARAAGNLAPSAFVHAGIDAWRNLWT